MRLIKFIVPVVLLINASTSAQAWWGKHDGDLTKVDLQENMLCFGPDRTTNEQGARDFLNGLIADLPHEADHGTLEEVFHEVKPSDDPTKQGKDLTHANIRKFISGIRIEMRKRACAFKTDARFDTIEETADALINKSHPIKDYDNFPVWLKPGFIAVISATDAPNTVVVTTDEDGFKFLGCRGDDGTYSTYKNPSLSCPPIGPSVMSVPINEWFKRTRGVFDEVKAVMRAALANTTLAVSNLSFLAAAPVFSVVANLMGDPQDTVTKIRMTHHMRKDMARLFDMGSLVSEERNSDGEIVTAVLPRTYQEIVSSISDLQADIFKKDYAKLAKLNKNPRDLNILIMNPVYETERKFNKFINSNWATWNTPNAGGGNPSGN